MRRFFACVACVAVCCSALARPAAPTAFTHQGRLASNGLVYSGTADLKFSLFDAAAGGNAVATPFTSSGVVVSGGVYTTSVDFGSAFGAEPRWLEVAVATPSGSGVFTTLSPREPINAVPLAASLVGTSPTPGIDISQTVAESFDGVVPDSFLYQTFVPHKSGKLLSFQLKYRGGSAPFYVVSAYITDGVGNLIPGASGSANVGPEVDQIVTITLGTPAQLQAAQSYRLYAKVGDGSSSPSIWISVNNPYPDGMFASQPTWDLWFTTTMNNAGAGTSFDIPVNFAQNVGIGTATPGAPLHVAPTSGIVIGKNATAGGYTALALDLSAESGGNAQIQAIQSSGSAYGNLVLNPNAGNVLVGAPDGSYRLDVQSPAASVIRASSSATATNLSLANTSSAGRNYLLQSNGNNLGTFTIRDQMASSDRFTLYPSGRIGLGSTTSPAGLLDVTGNGAGTVAIIGRAGPGPSAIGIYGVASGPGPKAAQFDGPVTINGNLTVVGNVSKTTGSFRIPHPLDPDKKWLYHSFVESPDMMNVYNGMIVLDERGCATVELPDYFMALNSDYRYQLTPVGSSMPGLFVSREVEKNSFAISGGKAGGKVSWQVTGIRQDEAAKKERIVTEVERTEP